MTRQVRDTHCNPLQRARLCDRFQATVNGGGAVKKRPRRKPRSILGGTL
jgi:hypothetical protein